jgi:hypothetical protein
MNNLIFFNKEGDALNFTYNATTDSYASTLNFDENSSDTFKTIGLYLFEKVNSFEFDSIDNDTNLQKFQLFNENRFTFTGNSYFTQSVTDIQPVNNNIDFYSKWIFGENFEKKYPLGSSIKFNHTIFDVTNLDNTYVVVGTKKNAIMILTNTDNKTFTNLYTGLTFSDISVSGLNSIGIYDYRRGLINQLSDWSEPTFYNKLYANKKLTIISGKTNYIATIENPSLLDRVYYKYNIDNLSYTQSATLSVSLTLKTDLPTVYNGGINIINNKIFFSNSVPKILRPNLSFLISESLLNTTTIVVDAISAFTGNINAINYPVEAQVMWNNLIYQCIQNYTQSATSSITPDNSGYWTSSVTYLPSYGVIDETILNTSIHLTTNKLSYVQSFTNSNVVTMASFAQRYASDFKTFNIDLIYDNNTLSANLKYASNYASIDYKIGTQSITNVDRVVENIISTKEILKTSIDTNLSSNFKYSLVIDDMDEFGLKVLINDHIYQEPVDFIYNGLNVDLVKTIDRTLRNFVFNHFARLSSIGIDMLLESNLYIADFDFYKDTITFTTQYPNVPLKISVEMGTTANFYIKHSRVTFDDMGSYLNININGRDYGQKVTSTHSVFIPDIPTAISNWVDSYYDILYGYGVIVSCIRENLYFNISEPNTRLKYSIRTNKLSTPGIDQYTIYNSIEGYFGTLIAGNQVVLTATSSQNFESVGFSTGMITSINNTVYPYDNQEYNILYIDGSNIGLSYQGPFWDTYGTECTVSSFTTLAYSPLAYSVTPCSVISTTAGGEFNDVQFDSGFSISYVFSNDYTTSLLDTTTTNLKDMLYINEYRKIYTIGNNLSILNADTFEVLSVINIVGNNDSIKIVYNDYNKYVYILVADGRIIVIDPISDTIFASITVPTNCKDITINQVNGDVYYTDGSAVYILYYNSFVSYNVIITITNANKMEYNLVDRNIYVTGDKVYVINTITRSLNTSYIIPSLDSNYIFTEPIYGSMYVWGNTLTKILDGVTSSIAATNTSTNKILYNNFDGNLYLSQLDMTNFINLNSNDNIIYTRNFDSGDIIVNQFDGDIYMVTSVGRIIIIKADSGAVRYTTSIGFPCSKIIYNPLRNSCIAMGVSGSLYEIAVTLTNIISLSPTGSAPSSIIDGLFGSLSPDYVAKEVLWLKTREYIRGPRENYSDDKSVDFVWKFENDTVPNIFMYDVSGTQLPTGTSYSYIGPLPLPNPVLNDAPNKDLSRLSDSSAQQTIFDEITNTLGYLDSSTDLSILPTPMQLFLGYNSSNEGYESTTLKMYRREDVSFIISYSTGLNNDISLTDYVTYGIIQMNQNSLESFIYDSNDIKRGLKVGQIFRLDIVDITNSKNKYISYNSGKLFQITSIFNTQIVVKYLSDIIIDENNIISDYPTTGEDTYLKFTFTVVDKEVVSINLFGQTEIEDIRYKIELNNTGNNIDPTDAYIFNTYDIDEQGIDWGYLNKKRKEMLIVRHDIFPYVGSYKAIINAINYFGYNDLELYEYYRNININSPNFFKLFKVEIPDIFDNTVEGWTVNDFIKHTMPNPNFEETNLFNLTCRITDKQGNNVLLYSLQEVIIKLQGLKDWLERKVVPITHRILDITGRADFVGGNYVTHKSFSIKGFRVDETMTPIDFAINEAYLMPVNSGSTVYNVVIDFMSSKIGELPKNFDVFIRTYKTYLEWNPFTTYNIDDEVIYYGIIYKSMVNTNRILDPRKYDNIGKWSSNIEYFNGQIANYNRYAYEYLGTQSSFVQFGTVSVPTPAQTDSWLNISEWVQQDLVPVQNITEYRYIDSVTYSNIVNNTLYYTSSVAPDYLKVSHPYNFTIDSNIDPFIVIQVTSDNGYGVSYTSKKNYEIRGLNDLYTGVQNIESIGPFVPISPVTTPL